ncbi:MAG: hypothetical protein C4532_08710 [Candidatus Abyssobacteria bacterium SURF_17]|uniref:Uncharacterized protein n=1 Tax=Candidatus Abyssobacteria bacterium SURF_17 TaxID=2093361 RepID=A0A419EZS4_9BACT|nr:MAG: hypothetical protein C4532_08710 [Candidatus Abyssubacteria bacterium SURF_17]
MRMQRVATRTVQARPLIAQRIKTVPQRITGLHRVSVSSRQPFEVDIGGRSIPGVRTLEVFHETPMFIDSMEHVAALDVYSDGEAARMIHLHPAGANQPVRFRITAHETMPERAELEAKKKIASVAAPLEYKGFLKHALETLHESSPDIGEGTEEASTSLDTVASVIALAMVVGAGLVFASALAAPLTLAVMAPVVCDPSRTYINGKLFKNLKEVKVKLAAGRIVGYTSP